MSTFEDGPFATYEYVDGVTSRKNIFLVNTSQDFLSEVTPNAFIGENPYPIIAYMRAEVLGVIKKGKEFFILIKKEGDFIIETLNFFFANIQPD